MKYRSGAPDRLSHLSDILDRADLRVREPHRHERRVGIDRRGHCGRRDSPVAARSEPDNVKPLAGEMVERRKDR